MKKFHRQASMAQALPASQRMRRRGALAWSSVALWVAGACGVAGAATTAPADTVDPALAYAPGIRVALAAARDARGVTVGLDALIDLGLRPRAASSRHEAPVDEGGVPGQVARATGA